VKKQDTLNEQALEWLLDKDMPDVRYLALRDLLECLPDDPELQEARSSAHRQGIIAKVLAEMDPAGFWVQPGPGYNPKYTSTVWAVILLAQLGARMEEDGRIAKACIYLLEHALTPGGVFSSTGAPSGTADCLQGNLCWALLELGCRDARLENAFEWLSRTVTGEGIAPMTEKNAPVRYYAGKCGPGFACGANNKLPCAWGAVKVLLALGTLPASERTPLIQRAIEQGIAFLFSVDPVTALYPSGYSSKPSQSWWKLGFPVFYITDVLQIGEALAGLGYAGDERLENLLDWLRSKQDDQGRWALEYDYTGKTWGDFGLKKQPNKWVTLRALRVLKAAQG
jgi:hypothetical protein